MAQAIVDGLGGVLFKFPFRVPAYYALILRSLTVLEGLALQADTNYKLLGKAYPYMAKRLLIDPAPELRYEAASWLATGFSQFSIPCTLSACPDSAGGLGGAIRQHLQGAAEAPYMAMRLLINSASELG